MDKKANVYLMYMIAFLQGFVFYGPIATLYRQSRGLSLSDIFLIESISWILMILFEIPWGWFADRFGYKKTLVISNFVFFLSKIVFYKAHSFGIFFLERVLISVSCAGLSGCDAALLFSSVKPEESQKVFGRYQAFSNGGYLIASLLFSVLIRQSMDSTVFWTIIPYALAAALTCFLKDVDTQKEERSGFFRSLKRAFENRGIILLVISFALINEAVQAVSVFLNQSQYLRSGIDIGYFGVLAVLMQFVRLSSARAYQFSIRLGENRALGALYIAAVLCCITLVFTSNGALTVLSVAVLCGSAAMASPIVLDMQNKSITGGDRATLLSAFAMLGDLIAAGANVGIGWAADISTPIAFAVCAGMCVCAFLLLLIYNKAEDTL